MNDIICRKNAIELYYELKNKLALTPDEIFNYEKFLYYKNEKEKPNPKVPVKRRIQKNTKQVICLTENKIFPLLSHCAEYYSLSTPRLVNCIRRQGQTKNGLKFAYFYGKKNYQKRKVVNEN